MPTLELPDQLAHWPWPRTQNPFYDPVAEESAEWLRSFGAFPKDVQSAFDKCKFGLLASLAYPKLSKEHLRVGCDLMNVFFIVEEFTDEATAQETAIMAEIVMDALRRPSVPRPADEWVGGEITRQFWHNAVKTASAFSQAIFIKTFGEYMTAVVGEAADREAADATAIHTIESFIVLRKGTAGALPSFSLVGLAMELPESIFSDPIVEELIETASEMVSIANDLVSYNKERPTGAVHNLVTIVQHQAPPGRVIKSAQEAVYWVVEYHGTLERRFLELFETLKSMDLGLTPTQKKDLLAYIEGAANLVRATDQWSYENMRYFGNKGPEVKKTRRVEMLELKEL